jgi:uncharacterized protein (DUF1015 family)
MATLAPFHALRPAPESAAAVASVPYDVVSTEEARALAAGNPLSFLHVTRAEIDLPSNANPYAAAVYEQAVRNFEELKRTAPLVLDDRPSLYIYRLRMGGHEQTGVAGCFSLDEYNQGLIKKHEKTRKDKEDDRTRHMLDLRAQTGIVFLTYHASAAVDAVTARATSKPPLYEITAPDGVCHTVWQVRDGDMNALVQGFAQLPALYIADGHHRVASAARAYDTLRQQGGRDHEASRFIAVAFPDREVQILAYNRIVKDLRGQSAPEFLRALQSRVPVQAGSPVPQRRGEVSMYLAGEWHAISLPSPPAGTTRAETLDVERLHRVVLEPLLGIGDIRTDRRIDFVGGIRGADRLKELVDSGKAAVAFSMYPVAIADLVAISDEGDIMPPKSTWFEPKLRDALLVHLI